MKKLKMWLGISIVLVIMLVVLTGCANKNSSDNNTALNATTNTNKTSEGNKVSDNSSERVVDTVDYKAAAEKQMAMPNVGDTVAILHIKDYGDVKVKFFPEVAPKAVENFTTHAKEGYYDGLTFHRVINEFMIQGGDPEGTGMGGESIWGDGFGTELDYELVPYRGSLCMAMSSLPNSIGSQFFITQAHYDEAQAKDLKQMGYPEKLLEEYKTQGGYLSLYLNYTVFGQVYEGIEVVDKIAKETPVTDSNGTVEKANQPVIESIEVTEYK